MITETDFDAKLSRINRKIKENKTKNVLVKKWIESAKNFWFDLFYRQESLWRTCYKNYLLFQPLNTYFIAITNTDYISSWKSKGFSSESIMLLWYQNRRKIYWKLFKTIKNLVYLWKSSKYLHCLWTWCIYNQFHDILRHFNVLPNFLFTTSETLGD